MSIDDRQIRSSFHATRVSDGSGVVSPSHLPGDTVRTDRRRRRCPYPQQSPRLCHRGPVATIRYVLADERATLSHQSAWTAACSRHAASGKGSLLASFEDSSPLGLSIGTTNLVAASVGRPPVIRRSVLTLFGHAAPEVGTPRPDAARDAGVVLSGFVDRVGVSGAPGGLRRRELPGRTTPGRSPGVDGRAGDPRRPL